MILDIRNDLDEQQQRKLTQIIGLLMTRYQISSGHARKNGDENAQWYYDGIITGLNNADKIVSNVFDDYCIFDGEYEQYLPPSAAIDVESLDDIEIPKPDVNPCICKGNWRNIVKESEPFLDRIFVDNNGQRFRFYGIVHGSDDYYYGMYRLADGQSVLLSCVGDLETHGYTLLES